MNQIELLEAAKKAINTEDEKALKIVLDNDEEMPTQETVDLIF